MAKDNKEVDALAGVEQTGKPALLTIEALTQMLLQTQQQLAESQSKLADAILEARKPYVDPKVLEAKRQELEDRKKMIQLDAAERAARKRICPHVRENGTPNIKWQQHSNNIILGVCGTCASQFDARKPEDLALLRKDLKSQRNMGRAGEHARAGVVVGV